MKQENEFLEIKLSEIRDILLELEFLKTDILMLIDKEEEYFEAVVKESIFLHRLHLNYIKLFTIDLYKLIDERENYNLYSLINYCKTNISKINWEREINLAKLNQLENDITNVPSHFKDISLLRNKHYAHNDKNKKKFNTQISLKDFWHVLKTLQNVFSTIIIHFNNDQWIFDIQYRKPNVIKNAYKYKKTVELYFEHASKEIDLDFKKFKKIMCS